MATKRPFTAPPGIKIPSTGTFLLDNTAASTGTTVGALVISGGVGIGLSLNVGGRVGIGTNLLDATLNIRTSSSSTPGLVVQGSTSQTADYAQFFTSTGTTSITITKDAEIKFPLAQDIKLYATAYGSVGAIKTTGNFFAYGGLIFAYGVSDELSSVLSPTSLSVSGLNWSTYSSGSTIRWATNNPVRIQPTGTSVVPLVINNQSASWTSGNAFEIRNNEDLRFTIDYTGSTRILSTVGSASTTSGALVVSGGAGIAGSIFVGATISAADNIEIKSSKELRLNNSGNTFYTGLKAGSNASNTTYTLPAAFPSTGSSVLQSTSAGVMSWVPLAASGGGSGTVDAGLIYSIPYYSSSGSAITGSSSFTNVGTGISILYATNSTSANTGALVVSGGLGISGNTNIGGVTKVFSSAASTSPSTGALLIAGGVGISGQLSFAIASMGFTGITTNPSMAFIGATSSSPIILTVQNDNSLNWEGSSGQLFSIDNNLSSGEIFAVSDISGLPIITASAGQTVAINEFGGFTKIGNGTLNSSSTSTGSLLIAGGLGITGNAFIGGTSTVTNTTASTSSASGALVVSGGVGIGQTLFIGGNLYQNTNAITAFDTGFRNRIINGDGNIDQRNNGSTAIPGVGATNFIDRWKMNVYGSGRLTIGQNYGGVTPPDGFVSYIGMKTTTTSTPAANDYNFLTQMIEGSNTIDLQWGTANAKPITISFWVYSSLTGTFGGSLRNSSATRSYPYTYTISASNTWEKKTVVIPGDTTGTWSTSHLGGLEIIFVISNGTTWQATPFTWVGANATGPSGSLVNLIGTLNATLYLTGIQVEIGSVATPYERRNYGHEFALCQRYYQITEVRVGGYHTTGGELRGSGYLNAAMRPITSPILTVLATDESSNLGTLNVDGSNFRGDSFRYIVAVTTTGTAYGQWKVSCDTEF